VTIPTYAKFAVVMAGVVGLGIELAAERLLAPAFGTTLDLWSIIIGLTFTFLSLGYAVGGRLIDRNPSQRLPALCLLAAGGWGLVIALLGRALVWRIQEWTFDAGGVKAGIFISTLLLFTIPPFVLGMVTPAAVRLTVPRVGEAGSSAGVIYALGTLGSLVGTFLPVIGLIPRIGVRYTFVTMAATALLSGALGLSRLVRPGAVSAPEMHAADALVASGEQRVPHEQTTT
jgi:hypothetical protein